MSTISFPLPCVRLTLNRFSSAGEIYCHAASEEGKRERAPRRIKGKQIGWSALVSPPPTVSALTLSLLCELDAALKTRKHPQKGGGGKSKANARQPRRKINTPRVLKGSPKLCSFFRAKKNPRQEKRGEMAHGRVSRYGNKARVDGRGGRESEKRRKPDPPPLPPPPGYCRSTMREGGL